MNFRAQTIDNVQRYMAVSTAQKAVFAADTAPADGA